MITRVRSRRDRLGELGQLVVLELKLTRRNSCTREGRCRHRLQCQRLLALLDGREEWAIGDHFPALLGAIEAFLQDSGLTGPRAAQLAAYATRDLKDPDVSYESLLEEWRQRADRLGLDREALADLVGQARVRVLSGPGDPAAERVFAWLASPDVLTERSSTFGRREVFQALAAAVPRGAGVSEVVALGDAFLASDHVVLRASGGLRACDVIRRRDGTVIAAHVDEERWTTPEMLATEHSLVDSALARRDVGIGIADHDEVVGALDRHPGLSDEQEAAVWRLTGSGAGVEVMLGAAGTGKTAALEAAREAWTACGHRVIGGALAARTAAQLTDVTGIPSMTLHRLLSGLDDPERGGLAVRSVVVIDEAAMVGTRTLARILGHAERAEAKVVLVGDHHQLPEIDAGGAFVGLASRLDVRDLTWNRRQRATWEREALQELRTGDPDRAFFAYQSHGRIKQASHGHDIREDLVDDWWTARAQDKQAIMVAGTNRNVDDLNDRARVKAHDAGRLGTEQLTIGGRDFAVGDEVIANRNDYRLGVLNGSRATITALDHEGRALHAEADLGEIVVFPPAYLDKGHLAHGYATTLHKAQGSTVDAAFILADETLTREHAYTALSRGTDYNALYIASPPDGRVEERHAPEHEPDAVERLRTAVRRSTAKTTALDAVPPTLKQLRDEHARLHAAIGLQPGDPARALNDNASDLQRAEEGLAAAGARRRGLEERLDTMRGLRRLTHRDERAELEDVLHQTHAREADLAVDIAYLETDRDKLTDEQDRYATWKSAHAPELHRLRRIEADINAITRRPIGVDRAATVEHEIDTGLGL